MPVPAVDATLWAQVPEESVALTPVPLDAVDTSKYVRQAVDQDSMGAVETVDVRVAYDDERVAVRLDWPDPARDDSVTATEEFADKAAIAFPLTPAASIMSMGSPSAPVNAWYWRADRTEPYDVLARGFGDVTRRDAATSGLAATATYAEDTWHLVFARRRTVGAEDVVDLESPPAGIALAVWEGRNRERGPCKSYSGEFETLELE